MGVYMQVAGIPSPKFTCKLIKGFAYRGDSNVLKGLSQLPCSFGGV